MRTAELELRGVNPLDVERINLCNALHTLRIVVKGTGDCAQALARLKDSTTLESLTLDLYRNGMGDAGAQALAITAGCPVP